MVEVISAVCWFLIGFIIGKIVGEIGEDNES